jgi:hypothetical protein
MLKKFHLTYSPNKIQDGYFAQLQRQFAILAITRIFHFSFYLTPISGVTTAPLDPFNTDSDVENYISKLNDYFLRGVKSVDKNFTKIIEVDALSLKQLLRIILKNIIKRGNILIRIANPHGVTEKLSNPYRKVIKYLPEFREQSSTVKIVAHIRMPINLTHIVPGETSTRFLDESYFINVIRKVLDSRQILGSYEVIIVTDAPEQSFKFKVVESQKNKYEQYEYLMRNNRLHVSGHLFLDLQNLFNRHIRVIRGGDPLESIKIMASADYFIMSKSSMSFIAGLLNRHGMVIYPPNFWHKPFSSWKNSDLVDSK